MTDVGGQETKLCLIGDSSSPHTRRWAEHFSKTCEILVISDSEGEIPGIKVKKVFQTGAGARNVFRIPRMRRMVKDFSPDIVHGHCLTVGGLYGALSGGKRIVGSAWGSDVYMGPRCSRIERTILKYVLWKCDLVFAGTKDMAERIRQYGYHGDLALFRFGVDPSAFRKKASHGTGEFRILSIRPCSAIYNPLVVLEAFKEALPHLGKSFLYVFDFGNMIGEVHRHVDSDVQLKDHVRFVPRTELKDMTDYYNRGDVALSIPNSDSAAASVLEAMACEVPVIACDIPNMGEWIEDGVNGYLCEIDAHRLAEKLRKAYSIRSLLPSMGKRARQVVVEEKNQGTFDSNTKVAEAAYNRLLGTSS